MYCNNKAIGVYAIICSVNGFRYVGSASGIEGFAQRCRQHYYRLRQRTHHSIILQVHFDRYGEKAFEFVILEVCANKEDCILQEQKWLDINGVGSENKSYNLSPTAGSPLGIKHSPEVVKRRAEAQRGKKLPPLTEERKARLRAANLGKKYSAETRAKVAAAGRGRKQSEETKAKRVASNKANPWTPEMKARANALVAEANSKSYVATSPEGIEYPLKNLAKFCREHNLSATSMVNSAKGKTSQHKGWQCRYAEQTKEEHQTKIQLLLDSSPRNFILTSPEGIEYKTNRLAEFARKNNLSQAALSGVASGSHTTHRGWRCRYLNPR
ncbi:MAG: GIY-YIG nuclease family protein [Chroococcidiopsis sp.]